MRYGTCATLGVACLATNPVDLTQQVVVFNHCSYNVASSSCFRYIIERMSQEASDLLKKALNLPVAERAELAGSLIESLDETNDESVQAAWDAEIVRRMEDLDFGKVKPVSLEEARRRLSSAIE
jgi:putative addiction module component (TIGR02574 family)